VARERRPGRERERERERERKRERDVVGRERARERRVSGIYAQALGDFCSRISKNSVAEQGY
jgi:hypothetical protein